MSRAPSKRKLAEAADLIAQWRRHHKSLEKYHDAMGLEHDYCLKLKQHAPPDPTKPLSSPQPLQIAVLDLYDIVRYECATIDGVAIYLNVKCLSPARTTVEQKQFDEAAEIMRGVMDAQLHDIDIGYPDVRRRFIRMSSAARVGGCRLDLVPNGRGGTDVIPIEVDPRNISWDTRFNTPFKRGNKVLWEKIEEVPIDDLPDMVPGWKTCDQVGPDDGEKALKDVPRADPSLERDSEIRKCTIVVGWQIEDPEDVEVELSSTTLEPQQWYMACPTCGYTEQDLRDTPGYDGSQLPETLPCPHCMADSEPDTVPPLMHRIETEREIGSIPEFEGRRRRVTFAPFSPQAGYFEEPWPKKLTGFPYLLHTSDPFPLEPSGNSQTFLNMDLNSLKSASISSGFQQMERNRDLLIVKKDALMDAADEPYQFDGTGDFVAYTQDYENLQGIKHFQGQGLNTAYPTWMQIISGELSEHRGIGQVALSAEQMKGVQVGTIARSMETGDVPLDQRVKILREDEERLGNRWMELLLGAWSTEQWTEVVGADGVAALRAFIGPDMPPMRLYVDAAPDLNAVDREILSAANEMSKIQSPALMRYAGKAARLPKSVVEELVAELTARTAATVPPGTGAPGPAGPAAPPQGYVEPPPMPAAVATAV